MTLGASCNCCLNIRRKQTETRSLNKTDREIECLAHINTSLQLINELGLTVICIEAASHIIPHELYSQINKSRDIYYNYIII